MYNPELFNLMSASHVVWWTARYQTFPPPNTNQTKIATQMMTMTSRTATIAITYLSGELSEIGRFSREEKGSDRLVWVTLEIYFPIDKNKIDGFIPNRRSEYFIA